MVEMVKNNEVVLDLADHRRRLPGSVEAFFFMPEAGDASAAGAARAREAFIREYRLPPSEAPPVAPATPPQHRAVARRL